MRRVFRATAAGVLGLAFLMGFVATCPCAENAAAPGDTHGCCVPQAGLREAAPGCCTRGMAAPQARAPRLDPAIGLCMTPTGAACVAVGVQSSASLLRDAAPLSPSPPTVLRI